jgi:hypothetical protein
LFFSINTVFTAQITVVVSSLSRWSTGNWTLHV